jgi:hypothetical protein
MYIIAAQACNRQLNKPSYVINYFERWIITFQQLYYGLDTSVLQKGSQAMMKKKKYYGYPQCSLLVATPFLNHSKSSLKMSAILLT